MQFDCQTVELPNGRWTIRHASTLVGAVEVWGDSHHAAAEKMRKELRYRLEICPCTGQTYDEVEIELVEARNS